MLVGRVHTAVSHVIQPLILTKRLSADGRPHGDKAVDVMHNNTHVEITCFLHAHNDLVILLLIV